VAIELGRLQWHPFKNSHFHFVIIVGYVETDPSVCLGRLCCKIQILQWS